MPIEMPCTGCGQKLRVSDEHAGKMARCPQCGTIARVPDPDGPPSESTPPTEAFPRPDQSQPTPKPESRPVAENPFAENPYTPPHQPQISPAISPGSSRHLQPHRGGAILALGIAGIACCVICGIIAWAMGSSDLKRMQAGTMDPSGRGLTQAGMILGIVATVIGAIGLVVNVIGIAAGGL